MARDDLIAVGLRGLALNDDRTVQMLTALGGQIDALLLQWRQHARQHGSGSSMLESLPMRPPMISLLEQPTTKISPVSRCAACSSSSAACRACAVSFA